MTLCTPAVCQSLPIGAMPMHYNSSFAGSAGNSRISSHALYYGYNESYGEQYSNSWAKRRTYGSFTSFDRFFPGIRSGVGVTISRYSDLSEQGGDSWFYKHNTTQTALKLDFAPKFSIKGKYTISPSFGFSFYTSYVNIEPPGQQIENGRYNNMSGRFGILFNAEHYYVGYTMQLFSSDFESISFKSYHSNVQFGYTFQRSEQSKFSFTPQVMISIRTNDEYNRENIISNPIYNLGFRYGQFLGGVINNLRSELVPTGFQLGWQNKGWRIVSSHEFDFEFYKIYSPSLSVRYIFNQSNESIHIYRDQF
jgi:hypothetical protein